jgi:hypothetical protein
VLLKTIILRGKYGVASHVSLERREEGTCVITLHHSWGKKGVVFFKAFFDSFIRGELRVPPVIDATADVVTVSFHKPLKES